MNQIPAIQNGSTISRKRSPFSPAWRRGTARELKQYLRVIDRVLSGKTTFHRAAFKKAHGPITAEQLFVNQKISDLIANAEMEQNDYRRGGKPNVFFGAKKRYFDAAKPGGRDGNKDAFLTVSVFAFNTADPRRLEPDPALAPALDLAPAVGRAKEIRS